MSPVTTITGSEFSAATIVLDCSALCTVAANPADVDRVLEWIRAYPRRSAIHAYVPISLRTDHGRRMKATLQSLGCTVRTRCAIPQGY